MSVKIFRFIVSPLSKIGQFGLISFIASYQIEKRKSTPGKHGLAAAAGCMVWQERGKNFFYTIEIFMVYKTELRPPA
jgi:hypothetical protein